MYSERKYLYKVCNISDKLQLPCDECASQPSETLNFSVHSDSIITQFDGNISLPVSDSDLDDSSYANSIPDELHPPPWFDVYQTEQRPPPVRIRISRDNRHRVGLCLPVIAEYNL